MVQHCGQACLLRHHMVLGVMVFCSLQMLKFQVGLTLLRLPPDTGLLKTVLNWKGFKSCCQQKAMEEVCHSFSHKSSHSDFKYSREPREVATAT